jgi:hypothetical protein
MGVTPFFFAALLMLALAGCTQVSYRGEKLKEAIAEIAREEYGIDQCDVKMNGTTLGVFLPLKQLFAMDFKEALMSGKVTDMEQLFQPTEEAIDKVEDMLFSMSRVMLSTDKKIEFYYLQATDVDKTGMELSFLGNIDDVKKVRFWDIPRSEYRKRVIHEIQLNRAVLWHKPVRQFFRDLGEKKAAEVQEAYFKNTAEAKWAKEFFFTDAMGQATETGQMRWEVLDIRGVPIQDNEVMVYAKVRAVPVTGNGHENEREYLFQVSAEDAQEKIRRIIPMKNMDEIAQTSAISLTRDLVYKSLDQWENEFKVPDITMGDFLSRQLTRRIQQAVSTDERIGHTFSGVKLIFKYESATPEHFSFYMTAPLKSFVQQAYSPSQGVHEDVIYLWEMAAREFVEVVHSYGFNDWQYLELGLTQTAGYLWKATRKDLERFRKHRTGLQDILELTRQT